MNQNLQPKIKLNNGHLIPQLGLGVWKASLAETQQMVKEAGHSDGNKYHELVRKMIEEQGADVVVLGCTELSFAEEMDPETTYPVADSQSIIVDRSLERALKLRQNNKNPKFQE